MRALITGITGFAGSHLAEHLLDEGWEVFGIRRWRSPLVNVEHLMERIVLEFCDIQDPSAVRNTLDEVRPDAVFHLAAQSYVLTSWQQPTDTINCNITGELNVLEGLRALEMFDVRVQLACSSEEYGLVHADEVPIKESNPLRPLSPYGVSKVAQDLLGYQYNKSYNMPIVRTRAFNHTGPRRGEVFVASNFARQIAQIEKGRREPVMMVGNLEARRDFTDVRDTVRAYRLLVEKGEPGEVYNICTGKSITIQTLLDMLLEKSTVKVDVKQDPERMRPSDVMVLEGDNTRLVECTGWQPTIPLEKTLGDLLDWWRERC